MPVTYCTAMTALFLFSCSYFPPWFFCISLFNWLEENKAEKWDSKVNIWNAVPLKKKLWFSMRWIKDLCPGMSGVIGTLITGLRNNSVFGLHLPTPSWTDLCCVPGMVTPLLLPSVMGHLCLWQTRSCHLAAFAQPAMCMKDLQSVHLFLMGSGYWVILLFNFTTFLKRPLSSDTEEKLIQTLSPSHASSHCDTLKLLLIE